MMAEVDMILISIHALLAESDLEIPLRCLVIHNFYPRSPCGERRRTKTVSAKIGDFYPRSPCGERPLINCNSNFTQKFLSTLSLRRATVHYDNYNLHCVISIHALLAESDHAPNHNLCSRSNFYPRSPCGERRDFGASRQKNNQISIHALLAESDCPSPC